MNEKYENEVLGEIGGDRELHEMRKMIDGYAKGTLAIIQNVIDNQDDENALMYPSLFLFRHFIEISIKYTYIRLVQSGEIERLEATDRPHGHDLVRKELSIIEKWLDEAYNWGIPEKATNTILQFHKIDPRGMFFKYTMDNKSKRYRPLPVSFGYKQLRNQLFAIESFFRTLNNFIDSKDDSTIPLETAFKRILHVTTIFEFNEEWGDDLADKAMSDAREAEYEAYNNFDE